MDVDWVAALVSGFAATVVMSLMMAGARALGLTAMPSMVLLTGSMMTARRGAASAIGAMIHYVVLGAVVFGLIYAWLFTVFDTAAWSFGALVGLVHGVIVGAVVMPMTPAVHPRMRPEPATAPARGGRPDTVIQHPDGTVELTAPGLMGRAYGGMTPAGLIVAHVVYGIVLALVYNALT